MSTRRITSVDRFLRWSDDSERAVDPEKKTTKTSRRRSACRIDKGIDVVVIEETDEPTKVFLGEGESSVFELTVDQ
jgi:hypothetical protein